MERPRALLDGNAGLSAKKADGLQIDLIDDIDFASDQCVAACSGIGEGQKFDRISMRRAIFPVVRVTFEIEADASKDDIRALVAQSQKRSAVFDLLTNPTNVHVDLA